MGGVGEKCSCLFNKDNNNTYNFDDNNANNNNSNSMKKNTKSFNPQNLLNNKPLSNYIIIL